MKHKNSNKTNW